MTTEFVPNTKVRHPGKPEWGIGTVLAAQSASHEGKPCQRLTVRFDGAGKKMINTAFAKLIELDTPKVQHAETKAQQPTTARSTQAPHTPAPDPATPRAPEHSQPTPPEPTPAELAERLAHLPDPLVDPFRDLESRLRETLACYRVEPDGRSLLQWASLQTGLSDPLSVLNRHELEEHFANYRIRLDRHLRNLLEEARRARLDPGPIIAQAPAGAQHALRRINPGR